MYYSILSSSLVFCFVCPLFSFALYTSFFLLFLSFLFCVSPLSYLVPITGFTFGARLAASATSGAPRFGGLTGGVYKAQEPIHRGSADPRLLAIPASCGRVAARNPNWGPVFAIGSALRLCDALSGPL